MYKKSWLTYLWNGVCWILQVQYKDLSAIVHVVKVVAIVTSVKDFSGQSLFEC